MTAVDSIKCWWVHSGMSDQVSGFQNPGVCLQAFPSFLPQPLSARLLAPFFVRCWTLVPRSLLLNRTETLATQATPPRSFWLTPSFNMALSRKHSRARRKRLHCRLSTQSNAWRSILKFSLRRPDMILAHNKKTQYAWISSEKEMNKLRILPWRETLLHREHQQEATRCSLIKLYDGTLADKINSADVFRFAPNYKKSKIYRWKG